MKTADSTLPRLLSPRFEVLSKLGEGGMGVVYEVRDSDTQALLAAKTLAAMSPEQIYWLKAEFRRLADLSHRNLVQLGELFYDGSHCFFTMERLHGVDLLHWLRDADPLDDDSEESETSRSRDGYTSSLPHGLVDPRAVRRSVAPLSLVPAQRPARRFDEVRLRDSLAQLAEALRTLHGFGIVHRDLKPSNILVEPGGRVVVLDFGIAGSLHKAEQKSDNDQAAGASFRGTPAFMAPEQVLGQPTEPAADWYAFGVVLFYALTGSLPFSGGPLGQLRAKLHLDAPSPAELVRDLPPDLTALCVQLLLLRSPDSRPRGERIASVLARAQQRAPTSSYRIHRGVFVGRSAELLRLHAALERVERGDVVALAVEGDPGLGKTELVHQFLFEAERANKPLLVLSGRCYEQEFVAFKGIDAAIDALSNHLKALEQPLVARMLPTRFHLLAALFPVLYRVPAVAASVPPEEHNGSQPEQREEAIGQLLLLLAALAQDRRLVIFIDDLQWAGDDTLALLRRLCEGPRRTPLLLLVTRRSSATPGPVVRAPGLSMLPAPSVLGPNLELLSLAPLSTDESSALTKHIFRGRDPSRFDAAQAESLLREAGGHPLFLRELARAIERGGELPRGLRLEDVLLSRIRALEPASRRLIEAVAIAGIPLPEMVFARVCNIGRAESARLVRSLRGEQLLRTGSTSQHHVTLEPYHDRVREAVMQAQREGSYQLALGLDVPSLHLSLARQLVRAGAEDGLLVPSSALAREYQLGASALLQKGVQQQDAQSAVDAHLDAARQARLGAAYGSALRYLEGARSSAGLLHGERARLAGRVTDMRALELAVLSEDFEQARSCFLAALAKSRGDRERTEVYQCRAQNQISKSRHARAINSGREGLHELGFELPERGSVARVLRDVASLELQLRGRSNESILALPHSSDQRTRAQTSLMMSITPAAYFTDTLLMSSIAISMAKLTLVHGLTEASGSAFASYSVVLAGKLKQYKRAYNFGQLAAQLNTQVQNSSLDCKLLVLHNLFCTPYIEPVQNIMPRFKQAQELGLLRGDMLFRTYAGISPLALALIAGTRLSESIVECETSLRIAEQAGNSDMHALSRVRLRGVRGLHGKTLDPLRLDGTSSGEAELVEQIEHHKHESACFSYGLVRAVNGCHSHDFVFALRGAEYAARHRKSQAFMPTLIDLDFYTAVAAARVSEGAALVQRAKLLWTAGRCVQRLAGVARANPRNFGAYHLLARAVASAAVSAQPQVRARAKRELREAALMAAMHGQSNVTALAWEQLAHLEAIDGRREAQLATLGSARLAYERWEAWACARRVDLELGELEGE